jgi:acyl-CoA synthetase (AMP-forming)/AMP-acid ligase II
MDRAEMSTLLDLLGHRAAEAPQHVAFTFLRDGVTPSDEITYADLDLRARTIAAVLQRQFADGDRALLLYPAGLEFIGAFFGCLYAGLMAVPAYAPRGPNVDERIRAIARDARPAVGLTTADLVRKTAASTEGDAHFSGLRWLGTDSIPTDEAASWRDWTPQPDTVAHLQYTSGSTATPKGVVVTHRNLLRNLLDMDLGWRHEADSVILSWLPHFHDMGLVYGLLGPVFAGVRGYLMPPISFIQRPVRWLQAISTFGVTHSVAPNFAYDLCVRKVKPADRADLDLRRWRVAVNGAEPIRADTLRQFVSAFAPCGFREETLCSGYGLAEATLKVSASQDGEAPRYLRVDADALDRGRVQAPAGEDARARTLVGCGGSRIDTEVVIVDPESGLACEIDRIGEIWVGGSTVAAGYWQRPDETTATFQARLADSGRGPFLRTGDMGFVNDGQLYITGRLKDLLIVRGQNHYPQDIELTVERSHPVFRANGCAAFPVDIGGEERVVIVQEIEREARHVDPAELAGTARQAVAEVHEINVYDVILLRAGAIPRTSSGKIQRHACRRAYMDGTFEGRIGGTAS